MRTRSRILAATGALGVALALAGCGQRADPRRIEGRWAAETMRFQGLGLPIGPDLSISAGRIGLGGAAAGLGLEALAIRERRAEGDEVTLRTEAGIDLVFAFEGDDRMYFAVPYTGTRIYYRRMAAVGDAPSNPGAGSGRAVAPVAPAVVPVASAKAPPAVEGSVTDRRPPTPDATAENQYRYAVEALRQGDEDAALRALATALERGFSDWQRIDGQPLFERLHDDVRFSVLRSRWKKG